MAAPQSKPVDLIVLHEHPEWQKPLFAALERRGVSFKPIDLKAAAFEHGREEYGADILRRMWDLTEADDGNIAQRRPTLCALRKERRGA